MRTYLSAARTGGQGKTTVVQLVGLLHELKGKPLKVASADSDSTEQASKIGRFLQGVRELGIGADLKAIKVANDPNAAIRYWDSFGSTLLEGGYVVDVGANIARNLFDWAEVSNAGTLLKKRNAPPIDLVVTVKAESQALEDASDLLQLSFDKEDFLHFERRFVVLNEVSGNFDHLPVERIFSRFATKYNQPIRMVRLPRCTSDLWPLMEREFISIREALRLTETDLEEKYGLSVWAANAGLSDLKMWVNQTLHYFEEGGLAPAVEGNNPAGRSLNAVLDEAKEEQQ